MSTEIYIEDYSQKSFVVRGETQPHKDSFKAMGGKWNARLTDKKTGEKFGAWLFWSEKRRELERWIGNGCQEVEGKTFTYNRVQNSRQGSSSLDMRRLEKKIDDLTVMVAALCEISGIEVERGSPPKRLLATVSDDEVIEDDSEDEAPPPKRLLKANKKKSKRVR